MDDLVYVAMTGAKQTELAQSVNSHNLANASTTGFRADLHAFSALPIQGFGEPTRVNAVAENYGTDYRQGATMSTGRDLDVAVQGEGFIAVQAPDGSEAYTRAGDLRINSVGVMTNGAGHPVMGNGGPVAVPPHASITVGADGTISIRPLGQGPETLATVDRIKLVRPDTEQLEKGADGLLRLKDGAVAEADAAVRLTSGALESSNVNVAETLVNMIDLARRYELQVKVMTTAAEDADKAAQLLSMSG